MSNFPDTMVTGNKVKAITRANDAMSFANAQTQIVKVMEAHDDLMCNMRENYTVSELETIIDAAKRAIEAH